MAYLTRINVALSVAVSSVATLVSPVLTPALIYLLASQWLPVSGKDMLLSTVQIVLIPIILGIIFKWILKDKAEEGAKILPLISVIGIVGVISAVLAGNKDNILESGLAILGVVVLHNLVGLLLGFFISKWLNSYIPTKKQSPSRLGCRIQGLLQR